MCREQLVKLRPHIKKLEAEGAAALGMSMDAPQVAARMAFDLRLDFPLLSDPQMVTVREYGFEGKGMGMPEMGYVVIDKQGRIQAQKIDRKFGEKADAILRALRQAKKQT